MVCSNCGKEVADNAAVCLNCGAEIKRPEGGGGAGWWLIGFLVPIAGLLMFLLCSDNQQRKAKKAGFGALVGFIVSVVIAILCVAFIILMPFILYSLI